MISGNFVKNPCKYRYFQCYGIVTELLFNLIIQTILVT